MDGLLDVLPFPLVPVARHVLHYVALEVVHAVSIDVLDRLDTHGLVVITGYLCFQGVQSLTRFSSLSQSLA